MKLPLSVDPVIREAFRTLEIDKIKSDGGTKSAKYGEFYDYGGAVYNVKHPEFGAKGDGVTDDSAAIQAAIDAAIDSQDSRLSTGGIYDKTRPVVFLPAGVYLINTQVSLSTGAIEIRGDGAIIKSTLSTVVFTCPAGAGWRMRVVGITFMDLTNAIEIDSNNLDVGYVLFEDVHFINCTTAATIDAQSSHVEFRNCIWFKCTTVLTNVRCDNLLINGGWIKEGTMSTNGQASIENYGDISISGVVFVPAAVGGGATETAWINNRYSSSLVSGGARSGQVYIERCRFGGETGSKTAVNNYAPADTTYAFLHTSIIIRDSDLFSVDGTSGSTRGIVRLFSLPNVLIMRGNTGMVDTLPVCWGSTVSPDTEISGKEQHVTIDVDNAFGPKYQSFDNPRNFIPEELYELEYVRKTREVTAATTTVTAGLRGWTFTNSGSSVNNNIDLPGAVPGLSYSVFRNNSSYNMRFRPQGTDTIGTGGAGKYVQIDTNKVFMTVTCFMDGKWEITALSGTAWGSGYSYQT